MVDSSLKVCVRTWPTSKMAMAHVNLDSVPPACVGHATCCKNGWWTLGWHFLFRVLTLGGAHLTVLSRNFIFIECLVITTLLFHGNSSFPFWSSLSSLWKSTHFLERHDPRSKLVANMLTVIDHKRACMRTAFDLIVQHPSCNEHDRKYDRNDCVSLHWPQWEGLVALKR